MDFIEQWFGVSPDGGSGALEMLYLIAVVVIAGGFLFRKHLRELIGGSIDK